MSLFVDKGIPVPADSLGRREVYPCRSMAVGDSFFVPGAETNKVVSATRHYRPLVFTCRAVTEGDIKGVRCWRVL